MIGPGLVLDRRRRVRAARRAARQRLAPARSRGCTGDGRVRSAPSRPARPTDVLALGGGPATFLRVLADQLERRRRRDVPELDGDPDWTLAVDGLDPRLERVHESLLDARRRPARHARRAALRPRVRGARRPAVRRLPRRGPRHRARGLPRLDAPCRCSDAVDRGSGAGSTCATGLLREEGPVTALRFSSLARPGTVALRAEIEPVLSLAPRPRTRRRTRRLRRRSETDGAVASFERLGAYDPDASRRAGGARGRRGGRLRAAAARAPGGVGAPLAGRRRRRRGRRRSCSVRSASRSST